MHEENLCVCGKYACGECSICVCEVYDVVESIWRIGFCDGYVVVDMILYPRMLSR